MDASCAYTLPDNMAPLVGTIFVNKLIERYASHNPQQNDFSLSTASQILQEIAAHYILNLGTMSQSCLL